MVVALLTPEQLAESKYNFIHNYPLDVVLLDKRDTTGSITTVTKYDENSIIIQHVDEKGELTYKIYNNDVFLNM